MPENEKKSYTLEEVAASVDSRDLHVPEEVVHHKFIAALPELKQTAQELISKEAHAATHGAGGPAPRFDNVMVKGHRVASGDLIRLLEMSMGSGSGESLKDPDLEILVAFAAVSARLWEEFGEIVKERQSNGETFPDATHMTIAKNSAKLRQLFTTSIGARQFPEFGEEDLSEWLQKGLERMEEPLREDATEEERTQVESARRADVPLFKRYLEGGATDNDIKLLIGEIGDHYDNDVRALGALLMEYSIDKNENVLGQIKNDLHDAIMMKHFERMLLRKRHGE